MHACIHVYGAATSSHYLVESPGLLGVPASRCEVFQYIQDGSREKKYSLRQTEWFCSAHQAGTPLAVFGAGTAAWHV